MTHPTARARTAGSRPDPVPRPTEPDAYRMGPAGAPGAHALRAQTPPTTPAGTHFAHAGPHSRALGRLLVVIALSAAAAAPARGGYVLPGSLDQSPALLAGAHQQVFAALASAPDTFTVRDVFLAAPLDPVGGYPDHAAYDLTIALGGADAPLVFAGPATAALVRAVGDEPKFDLVFLVPTPFALSTLRGDLLLEVTVRPTADARALPGGGGQYEPSTVASEPPPTPAPEPSSIALLGTGAVGLIGSRLRRPRAAPGRGLPSDPVRAHR